MRRLLAALAATAAWSAVALAPAPPESAPERRVLRLHCTPADRDPGRYQYVPVTIAEGTTPITIAYRYDRANGANAVDLGLFEAGPLTLGTRAFRGWSGGSRDQAVVAVDEAAPGYWPGALPAGEWHVALGLYKVAPAGVGVELQVETSRSSLGPTPALAPRPDEPIRRGEAWYAGDLHVHTLHSDGSVSAAAAARAAREAGLDFIAITDHNNTTHQLETTDAPGLLAITGEEVTTPGGHANVWGLRGWRGEIDFRLAGVGSSDWHRAPAPLGRAGVRVRAEELSTQAILAAIRAGRVVVMGDARTPPPILTVRAGNATAGIGDTLRLRADEVFDVEVVAADPAFAKSRVTLAATAGPPARRRFLPASPPASRASAPPSTWRRDPRRGRRAARPHQPRVRRRRESRSSVTHPTT